MPDGTEHIRVELLTPAFWPEVRRGTERFTHELATGLVQRGHVPRIVTSHRGRPSSTVEDGVRVVRVPRPPDGRMRRRLIEDYITHLPLAYAVLRAGGADIAHAMHGPDAVAALRVKRQTGMPVVYSFMGIPDHDGMFERRRRLEFVQKALAGCDAVVALSKAAQEAFAYWFGHDARLISPGVNVDTFVLGTERTPEPSIVCSADMTQPRKNVGLLVQAFRHLQDDLPGLRLILSRPRDPGAVKRAGADVPGVELADLDDRDALARAYGEAWVSALPSSGEAFGLVLAEALACGTPVVGTRAGGIPEIVDDRPEIGRLFDAGDLDGLTTALREALELAQDAGTREACRRRAQELSTHRTTEQYIDLYQEFL